MYLSENMLTRAKPGKRSSCIHAWLFADEIERGAVRVILQAFEPKPLPMHAVYPTRRLLSLKVRAMIDHLADEFRLDPKLSAYGM